MNLQMLPEYIQFLMNAEVYSHPVDEVRLIQTHISFVIVAGDFVYKWKKPIDLGFLNFSTLPRRRYYCSQELLLNRRLCPEIYLALIELTQDGDNFRLQGRGRIMEYGVKMVRLPEERMMNRLIEQGDVRRADIDRIIARLVPFYKQSDSSVKMARFGSTRQVGRNIVENFRQMESFVGEKGLESNRYKRIVTYSVQFLANDRIFRQRMMDGRIRDCHGDLHTANICLTDEVAIFDCIEFSRRLRYTDVAADVAFLAMDLDFHGLHDLSRYFVERFIFASGDTGLRTMLNFYKCYRACVRGKINLLTAADPHVNPSVSEKCREKAWDCFALAEFYAGQTD
jgi:aminoglycoside phosphotransferase family enzyme